METEEKINNYRFPKLLLIIYIIQFLVLSIYPYNRDVWLAENIVGLIPVIILIILYNKNNLRVSNLAFFFMACWIFIHTSGGHYTFELAFTDQMKALFNSDRNNYDRIAHVMVGFFAFSILKYVDIRKLSNSHKFLFVMAVSFVFVFAAFFELLEWIYSEVEGGVAGAAFLVLKVILGTLKKIFYATVAGQLSLLLFLCAILRWRKKIY